MDKNYISLYAKMYDYRLVRSSSELNVYKKTTGSIATTMSHDKRSKYILFENQGKQEKIKESDVVLLILNQLDYHEGDNNVK